MTDTEHKICRKQGKIFEALASEGYTIESLAGSFLRSDFCRRQFDVSYSYYQYAEVNASIYDMMPEIGGKLKKYEDGLTFNRDVAYWIGGIYRKLWFATYIPSRGLADKVPAGDLVDMYLGLHTIGDDMAVEDLVELYKLGDTQAFFTAAL